MAYYFKSSVISVLHPLVHAAGRQEMFAALYLATEPGARHGFEVFGRRGLLQPVEDFQCLRVMAERKERYDGVAVAVFK